MNNEEEKLVLIMLTKELTIERNALQAELERIKKRYGEHLDTLNNEVSKLRVEAKKRIAAFVEMMIYLQDLPPNE